MGNAVNLVSSSQGKTKQQQQQQNKKKNKTKNRFGFPLEGFGYTLASNPTLNSFESINISQSLKTRFVPVFSIAGIFYENCNFQILYGFQ
jgi:hypothetical protein